jgi:hypothetical protein
MNAPCRGGMVAVFCACVAGCVATATPYTVMPAGISAESLTIGKSTKADVLAALGKTRSISFESGFEVWAYQTKDALSGNGELVILFSPAGIVTKTRFRPSANAAAARGQARASP